MITISLCMIVKDEEDALSYCLYTVKDIVDEIIIVDMYSSDKTKETARKFTDKVYDFKYEDDYSKVRNFSFSKATKDYILWLDPHDILLDNDRLKLMQLKKNLNDNVDIVIMRYNYGKDEKSSVQLSFTRERLVKRKNNYQWKDSVYEYIEIFGNIVYEDIIVSHRKINHLGNKQMMIYKDEIINENKSLPTGNFYFARELFYHGEYAGAINQFEDFLAKDSGYIKDKINASIMLAKCYKLSHNYKKAIEKLVRTFELNFPSPEACCELGYCFKENREYKKAIQWFKIASSIEKAGDYLSVEADYYEFIPYVELSECYFSLKNIGMAKFYYNKAKRLKPNEKIIVERDNFYNKL